MMSVLDGKDIMDADDVSILYLLMHLKFLFSIQLRIEVTATRHLLCHLPAPA